MTTQVRYIDEDGRLRRVNHKYLIDAIKHGESLAAEGLEHWVGSVTLREQIARGIVDPNTLEDR